MPTSTTIDGISREHTNWPLVVDGISRETVSMLTDVDGTQREIFSGMHVWKRYRVATNTVYITQKSYESRFACVNDHYHYCVYQSYSESGNTFSLTGGTVFYVRTPEDDPSGYYVESSPNQDRYEDYVDTSDKSGLSVIYRVSEDIIQKSDEDWYLSGYKMTRTTSTTQTKGTYVDTVRSRENDAYPENGIYNGYWYVKIK